MKSRIILIILCLFCSISSVAQERVEKRYSLFFRVSRSDVDRSYRDNARTIQAMLDDIKTTLEVEGSVPDSLLIYASSSPEGSRILNERLAIRRAESTKKLLLNLFPEFNPHNLKVESRVNDWSGLIQTARLDSTIANRSTLLKILEDPDIADKESAIKAIPEVYAEVRDRMFDDLRSATITITVIGKRDEYAVRTERKIEPLIPIHLPSDRLVQKSSDKLMINREVNPAPMPPSKSKQTIERDNFYMSLKTNMLYDLATIPNGGLEFYLGKNFSIAANWMYSWWNLDKKNWYWRTYGGDLAVRYWLGKEANEKPLTGHHVGIYGQGLTYDFEVGKKGFLAAQPNWSAGLEYGYSLPIAKVLNLDFTLGLGYHWGIFEEYLPIDGHFVWQATKKRQYIGPTKLEVSLVWLLGHGNVNQGKGGNR